MLRMDDRPATIFTGISPLPNPIIATKLDPPPGNEGFITRPRLIEQLDRGLQGPLTLVHAPAGYGKSTLVRQWLQRPDLPRHAWLRLDEGENELGHFVAYLVAAVRTLFGDACPRTHYLLSLGPAAPTSLLTATFLNEVGAQQERFILVLEEYEAIAAPAVHHFLGALVEHQPRNLHLVLVTRTRPPLPLPLLRQRRLLNEIGVDDLRLTLDETTAILERALGAVDEQTATTLFEKTEGWVGGLHLVTGSGPTDRYLVDFFTGEVLSAQPHQVQEFLLETSLLPRFCPELVAAVCAPALSPAEAASMVRYAEAASLFLFPVAGKPQRHQYHRLFAAAMQHELQKRRTAGEIAALHRRAATWFEAHGEIDAAVSHWLAAGEQDAAADLVERQVMAAIVTEAMPALADWLQHLPSAAIRRRPALLLAHAWVEQARMPLPDIEPQLDAVERLLKGDGRVPADLSAGVAALSSNLWFWQGHAARSQAAAKEVKALDASANAYFASYALARSAMSRQMTGAGEDAVRDLDRTLQQTRLAPGAKAQLLLARAVAHLNGGHLHEVERSALALQRLAAENALPGSHSWAHYLLGRIYYEWDRLEEAAEHFRAVIAASGAEGLPLHDSYLGLALIYEGRGEPEAADEMVSALNDRFWERGTFFMSAAGSFRARQALERGQIVDALRQIEQVAAAPGQQSLSLLEIPALTHVRILMAHSTVASLQEVMNILRTLQRTAAMGYNRLRSVEVLALRALTLEALGETETALDTLQQALVVGERGGMVRIFADLGPPMAALLYKLAGSESTGAYVGQLLAAFPRSPHPAIVPAVEEVDALTDREWEVLALMGQRLSNKEIAQHLTISPHTVKKHASNIYQKLDVSSRRQAIARAAQLGLLSPDGGSPPLAFA